MERETKCVFCEVTLNDLALIRRFIRDTAVSPENSQAELAEFIVAVNEAMENIVRHGYKNQPGDIAITIRCSEKAVEVLLCDNGPGFDPTTVPSPDTMLPLEERPFGGLGVHLMRTYCDELHYRSNAHGGNELTLLKRFS